MIRILTISLLLSISVVKAGYSQAKKANPNAAKQKPVTSKAGEPTNKEIMEMGPKLVEDSGCLTCHSVNDKIIGPSFKMIRNRYQPTPANINKLIEKVYNGGTGVWGQEMMTPNMHIEKPEIKKMVRYILNLPK